MNKILDVNKFVSKGWGHEVWHINTELYCAKTLYVHENKLCSFHYHPIKNETFFLEAGEVFVLGTKNINDNFILSKVSDLIFEDEKQRAEVADNMFFVDLGEQASIVKLQAGDLLNIESGTAHIFFAYCNSNIMEMSTMHSDDDVVRLLKGD